MAHSLVTSGASGGDSYDMFLTEEEIALEEEKTRLKLERDASFNDTVLKTSDGTMSLELPTMASLIADDGLHSHHSSYASDISMSLAEMDFTVRGADLNAREDLDRLQEMYDTVVEQLEDLQFEYSVDYDTWTTEVLESYKQQVADLSESLSKQKSFFSSLLTQAISAERSKAAEAIALSESANEQLASEVAVIGQSVDDIKNRLGTSQKQWNDSFKGTIAKIAGISQKLDSGESIEIKDKALNRALDSMASHIGEMETEIHEKTAIISASKLKIEEIESQTSALLLAKDMETSALLLAKDKESSSLLVAKDTEMRRLKEEMGELKEAMAADDSKRKLAELVTLKESIDHELEDEKQRSEELSVRGSELSREKDELQSQVSELQSAITDRDNAHSQVIQARDDAISTLQSEADDLRSQLEESRETVESAKESAQKTETEMSALKTEVSELESAMTDKDSANAEIIQARDDAISALQIEADNLRSELEESQSAAKRESERTQKAETQMSAIKTEMSGLRGILEATKSEATERCSEHESEMEELRQKFAEVAKAADCGKELTALKARSSRLQQQLQTYKKETSNLQSQLREMERVKLTLTTELQEMDEQLMETTEEKEQSEKLAMQMRYCDSPVRVETEAEREPVAKPTAAASKWTWWLYFKDF